MATTVSVIVTSTAGQTPPVTQATPVTTTGDSGLPLSPPAQPQSQLEPIQPPHPSGFAGSADGVCFLVAVEQFLCRWGYQFANKGEIIEYILGHFDGLAAQWYVDLYRSRAPELESLPLFFRSFWARFGSPALTENACTYLKQLKQGSVTIQEYSAAFRTIASKLPDWPKSLLVDY